MDRATSDLACALATLHAPAPDHEDPREALRNARAELDALRRSEQLLTATLDATSDGMLALDAQGRPVFFNTRFAELWGLPEDRLGQVDYGWLAVHKASRVRDPVALEALTRRRISEPESEDCDLVEMLDGRVFERRAFPKRVQGRCVGSVVVFRDVTERLGHERTRRRHDAMLASLVESIPDPIFYKDRDGRYLGCNDAYAQLWGRAVADVRGLTCHDLFPPDEAATIVARDTAALSTSQKCSSENLWVMADGREVVFETVVSPLWDEDGRAQGLVGICRNVTQRKQAEQDSQRARSAAEEAAGAKADFLANISHEIRTPLNAVIGLADLVLRTPLDARQRDYMDKVRTSGRHLLRLVDDVLDFSKIEAGHLELEERSFALERLLDDVGSVVGEKCHGRGLELVFEVGADVPPVLVGDSLRLQQVLLNYANNAVKFTEHGEVVVGVERLQDGGEGVLLRFTVRDTGIGIPTDQLHRLFRSFSQAESSISRRYGGTGLGLAICKRLAECMGGEVGVESEPGHGSLFWFTARLRSGEAGQQPARLPLDVRGRRALVVDDNGPARTVTAEMLRRMGFEAHEVASGEAALEALPRACAEGRPYDLVYLDWRMPGLDGIATARRIRQLPLQSNVMVLMVTAYGRQEALQHAQSAGIASVLAKPVSPSALLDATMDALSHGKPAAPPAQPAVAANLDAAGARVLLVEDNEINQLVARELLLQAGAVVDIAGHGQAALDLLALRDYDLVLMDMQMPVMDGLTATRALRRIDRLKSVPVVGLTANALDSHRTACLEAGMDDFLVKPVDPARLQAALVRWTRRTPAAKAAGQAGPAALPRGIPGLEIEQGLIYAMGKETLYLDMLRRFADSQHDLCARIRSALAGGDRSTAERLAHTAVGSAGMLGAAPIAEAARALELAIGAGARPAALEPLFATLDGVLAPVISGLRAQLAAA